MLQFSTTHCVVISTTHCNKITTRCSLYASRPQRPSVRLDRTPLSCTHASLGPASTSPHNAAGIHRSSPSPAHSSLPVVLYWPPFTPGQHHCTWVTDARYHTARYITSAAVKSKPHVYRFQVLHGVMYSSSFTVKVESKTSINIKHRYTRTCTYLNWKKNKLN